MSAEVIDEDDGCVVGLSVNDVNVWKKDPMEDVKGGDTTGVCCLDDGADAFLLGWELGFPLIGKVMIYFVGNRPFPAAGLTFWCRHCFELQIGSQLH